RNRKGKSVRQDPLRPALAALPPQDRQGPRPTRQDRVQGATAPMIMPTFIAFVQKIGGDAQSRHPTLSAGPRRTTGSSADKLPPGGRSVKVHLARSRS